MAAGDILRGRVTAYPGDRYKGMVEVALGACQEENDKVYAQVARSLSGVYALPEIGDVVEVELEAPGLPGAGARVVHVHRSEDDAQTAACWTEENDKKQFKTRSGHTVTLDDAQDETAITVGTAGGLELRLEDGPQTVTVRAGSRDAPVLCLDMKNDAVTLEAGKQLTISCGGASITFDSGGNVAIQAKGTLTLRGREIALDAKAKLTAKGQQVEAAGSVSAKVAGQSRLELSSSGVTEVKGGMVKLN